MSLEIIKISRTQTGSLYKLLENKHNITIKFTNIKPLFKPDKYYNNFYIKWRINIENIHKILKLEKYMGLYFQKNVKSNLLKKENYPLMLNTKFTSTKNNPIIINGDLTSVPEFIESNLDKSYNISIEFGKIFADDDTVKYPLIIRDISVC